jgi:NAD(P)-dependent dehydrogenase (short-subunit alcohol dehydrogenase family)
MLAAEDAGSRGALRATGLEDRVALVTGAGRGIGLAIARALAEQGARVAVGDLVAPEIEGLLGVAMDVTDEDAVAAAVTEVEHRLGPVEILVCNAGIYRSEALADTTLADWDRMISVNLTGVFLTSRRVLPGMAERGFGRVVIMGSSAGKSGGARNVVGYAAAKAGAMAMAKGLAKEYARTGVLVNALAPALIDTEMIADMRHLESQIPAGRLGTTDDVASVVVFLASDAGSFFTGEVVDVNGGFLID